MAAPVCPNCGNGSTRFLRAKDYNRRTGPEVFTYYRCSGCRLLFLHPIPDDLGRFYPSDYYGLASNMEEFAQRAEHERYKIDLVKQFVGSGRLIEIGPGAGGFALLARDAGFQVRVIEMSQDSCDYLSGMIGVDAICTSDEAHALEAGEAADVIALWHVVEHLDDPFALVRAAARKLLPGGILVLAAPNPWALQFRLLQGRWAHVDAPRHVCLIPPEVLRSVAEASGLRLVLQTTNDRGSLGWNEFGWRVSLSNMFRSVRVKALATRVGGLLTRIMRPLEEREGRGSAYTMVFERFK